MLYDEWSPDPDVSCSLPDLRYVVYLAFSAVVITDGGVQFVGDDDKPITIDEALVTMSYARWGLRW